jgi:isopenicillin N synthase-like dioxygenase
MSFTSIPILDLELSRDPATKPEFLDQLRNALMEVGFLYLKNVGISDELWNEVIKEGKSFFDIPQEEKYDLSILIYIHIYIYTCICVYMFTLSFI